MNIRAAVVLLLSALSLPAFSDVGFTSDRYSTVSGNATVQLQVRRDTAGPAITLGYRTVSGSAIAGSDFVNQPSGTVTIPEGSAGPTSLSIPLIFNGSSQTRSFSVELTSATGDVLSGFVRADVQILGASDPSNNAGVVRFPVSEAVVQTGDLYVLSVSRENGSKGVTTVRLTSTSPDGSYDPIDTTLTWNDGQVGTKSIPVHATIPFFARSNTIVVPVQMTATGSSIQGAGVATVYFLSPVEEPPVAARFIYASQALGAATTGLVVGVSVPIDPNDENSKLGYSADVFGRTTDVLENRDYTVEGEGALTIDENGSATIELTFPSVSIADRQIEMVLYRFGTEIDRVVFTLLGTANDPYYRDGNNFNFGTFSFFGSETRLSNNAAAITIPINRTGPSPLSSATLQYRLTAEDGVTGRDTASATDVGTVSWDEGQVGSKSVIIPLIRIGTAEDRRFTLTISKLGSSTTLSSQSVVVLGSSSNNANTVGFTSDLRIFPQEADSAVAFVERRGSGAGVASAQYIIEDGNTVIGLDYPIDQATGSLTWEDGEVGAKMIVIDRLPRDVFQAKAFTIRLQGTDVISTSAVQTILIEALPLSFETAGQIQLERSIINSDTNSGSVTVKVQRAGGTQSKAIAVVRTTLPDATVVDRTLTWNIGDSADKSFVIPTPDAGTFTIEVLQVSGALKSDQALTVKVEEAGGGGGGGGAFGLEIVPLMLLALWSRRRRQLAREAAHA